MKKILTILAVLAVFVASFAAKAQDRTCKTDSICGREIVKSAMKYLGSPYRSGHLSPKSGFDCSGFTTFIFSKQNISLPRSSRSQYSALRGDSQIKDRRDLKAGDLVFFSGSRASKSNVGHVGIVTSVDESGNFKFIHSSCSQGVTVSSSQEAYYAKRYIGACRVVDGE